MYIIIFNLFVSNSVGKILVISSRSNLLCLNFHLNISWKMLNKNYYNDNRQDENAHAYILYTNCII